MFFYAAKLDNLEQVQAIHDACKLPMVLGSNRGKLTAAQCEAAGARILNPSHQIIAAVTKTMRDTYQYQLKHGAPADLTGKVLTAREMDELLRGPAYGNRIDDYMK